MNQQKKLTLCIMGVVLGSLALIGYIVEKQMMIGREAASIGIIGGADGPTVVFVASKINPSISLGIGIVLVIIIGILLILLVRNRMYKKK